MKSLFMCLAAGFVLLVSGCDSMYQSNNCYNPLYSEPCASCARPCNACQPTPPCNACQPICPTRSEPCRTQVRHSLTHYEGYRSGCLNTRCK